MTTSQVWTALDSQFEKVLLQEKYKTFTYGMEKQRLESLKAQFEDPAFRSEAFLSSDESKRVRWKEINSKMFPSEEKVSIARVAGKRKFAADLKKERLFQQRDWKQRQIKKKEEHEKLVQRLEHQIAQLMDSPQAKEINSTYYLRRRFKMNTARPHVYAIKTDVSS